MKREEEHNDTTPTIPPPGSSHPFNFNHTPVLLYEVLDALQPAAGKRYIDGTVGGGGHMLPLLLQSQPGGHVLGMDADSTALAAVQARLAPLSAHLSANCTLVQGNFRQLASLAQVHGYHQVDGILLDLGVSSYQLDTPARGFAFAHDGPLDMRLDPTSGTTAAELVATLPEQALADIIYQYGEERFSRRIARRIVAQRSQQPITTTQQLAELVQAVYGGRGRAKSKQHKVIHPATRTFQALRISVNGELESLEQVLPQAVSLLRPGGRLAIISFHSLEDRIVKWFFRNQSGYGGSEAPEGPKTLRIITKKPIMAGDDERATNPRSRSARLRVAERTEEAGERLWL